MDVGIEYSTIIDQSVVVIIVAGFTCTCMCTCDNEVIIKVETMISGQS